MICWLVVLRVFISTALFALHTCFSWQPHAETVSGRVRVPWYRSPFSWDSLVTWIDLDLSAALVLVACRDCTDRCSVKTFVFNSPRGCAAVQQQSPQPPFAASREIARWEPAVGLEGASPRPWCPQHPLLHQRCSRLKPPVRAGALRARCQCSCKLRRPSGLSPCPRPSFRPLITAEANERGTTAPPRTPRAGRGGGGRRSAAALAEEERGRRAGAAPPPGLAPGTRPAPRSALTRGGRGCEMAADGSRGVLGLWLLAAAGLCGGVAAGKSPSCHEVRTAFQLRQIGPLKLVPDVPTAGQYRPTRGVASPRRGVSRGAGCRGGLGAGGPCRPGSPLPASSGQRGLPAGGGGPGSPLSSGADRRGLRACLRKAGAPRLPSPSAGFPAGRRQRELSGFGTPPAQMILKDFLGKETGMNSRSLRGTRIAYWSPP